MIFTVINTILIIIILVILIKDKKPQLKFLNDKSESVILDSCTLIDGRIFDLIKANFVTGKIIIPKFILNELQSIADSHDSHKRERARFGLDIVKKIQAIEAINLEIDRSKLFKHPTNDEKLIVLAKKRHSIIYTTDYNLQKMADVEKVKSLNLNNLTQLLRPIALPGDQFIIKIKAKGEQKTQAVGYLDDGTMVVVENCHDKIGQTIPVIITKLHNTVAGKMYFAVVKSSKNNQNHSPKYNR